jgi:hydroxymethylpyrimidine pyrophosphatase-like HAD family hydrolase
MPAWGEPRSHLVIAIPAACGKLNAARHVQSRLGFADAACVAAGDSENDLPMVGSTFGFVAVANAAERLVRALDEARQPDLHYRAEGSHADGVIEGLQHFRRRMEGGEAPRSAQRERCKE